MAIIFENIDTGHTIGIDQESEGKYYKAKLSAAVNSSNMGMNASMGQDFGWRLNPEQQAIIEDWETDVSMIEKVNNFTKIPVEDLTHADFLSYMLYTQNIAKSPERAQDINRREKQADYDKRVTEIKSLKDPLPVAPFKPATVEEFLSGELTGDNGGEDVAVVKKSTKK